jgi:hypothetical protein
MVQPKYSPEEALQRIKLMMKYDTSKTLNENVETIKQPINEALPALLALPWLIGYGTAAAAGIGTWIYNVQGGGDAFSKAQTFFAGCSSLDKNLKPLQSKGDHREAANSIYNAIEGIGTDENAIKGAISSMESVADLCAMYKFYNKTYGDLYDDLDGDLDGEDFRKYVWSAIAPIVDDAEENLEQSKKEDEGEKEKLQQVQRKYVVCAGTTENPFKKLCYEKEPDGPLHKVQACLGVTPDGKFWNKTEQALVSKTGNNSFTINDVPTICKKPNEVIPPQDEVTSLSQDDEVLDVNSL